MAPNVHPNLQTLRVICGAIIVSALMVWLISFGLTGGGRDPLNPDFPLGSTGVTALGLAVGLAGLATGLFFASRGRAAATGPEGADNLTLDALSRLQTNLIIAWAMLEGAGLVLAVIFLLTGATLLPIIAAVILLHGFYASFPRAAWFPSPDALR